MYFGACNNSNQLHELIYAFKYLKKPQEIKT